MNSSDPLNPQQMQIQQTADQAAGALSSTMEAAREKLESARDTARETMHVAREKCEDLGSSFLQWTRDNPATALATVFASGLVIGCALTLGRHEKTFGERFSEDPADTLHETLMSVLTPLRERLHDAGASARSGAHKAMDSITRNGHSWTSRLRDAAHNFKR